MASRIRGGDPHPSRGEFIVGDIPALTVRKGMPSPGVNGGIGYAFADSIILPVAPGYLIRVVDGPSRYVEIDEEEVGELSARRLQPCVSAARKQPGGIHTVCGQAKAL